MYRTLALVPLVLLGMAAPQADEDYDEPPGYAEVNIALVNAKVTVTIKSIEDPATGLISCGSGDRCKHSSRITWSIKNNTNMVVNVKFENWKPEKPFPNDLFRNNIPSGKRRALTRALNPNGLTNGRYKYDIVVYDGSNVLGRLDPEIDIMN